MKPIELGHSQRILVVVGSGHKTNPVEYLQIECLGIHVVHCYDRVYSLYASKNVRNDNQPHDFVKT